MWIGIDDTDSRIGGCTTYLASKVISSIQELSVHLIGHPRLVRLNPNVPWKTRGNGAVSFRIGIGKKKSEVIGRISNTDIISYKDFEKSDLSEETIESVKEILINIIQSSSYLTEKNTNPGVVLVSNQFDDILYWNGVRTIVDKHEVIDYIDKKCGWFKGFNNGRGLIGATASIAWRGIHDSTFELIAYRQKERWGSDRHVDGDTVQVFDQRFPSTFDNYDYEHNHVNIVPNSPCPVLYGIRGENSNELVECMNIVKSEPFEDWLIFSSNQGTDDHLKSCNNYKVQPFQSVILNGTVNSQPETIIGGHVIFQLKNEKSEIIDCIAYEPTKNFRNSIRQLETGDSVKVFGGVREKPFSINLEKIEIVSLQKITEKIENPICPICNKHMKSRGKNQGYRCKKCGKESYSAIIRERKRTLSKGLYEVPVSARRHLSKPLKRK